MSSPKTVVLITGANIGVGFSTAKILTQNSSDYHVLICSRSAEKGKTAVSELQALPLKGTVSLLQLDVTDEKSINAAAMEVEKEFGHLDILINNTAIAGFESSSPAQQFREVLETNTTGPFLATEAFKPLLLKSTHPRLLFITSGLGSIARKLDDSSPDQFIEVPAYRASKAALNMLMAHFHVQLKDKGVKVHALCPGFVASNLRRDKEPVPGALSPDTSGETILKVIEGERDVEVAMVVHRNEGEGVYPW